MTEPKVVRYDIHGMRAIIKLVLNEEGNPYHGENPLGEWVRYSDYEKLTARVEELEATVEQYRRDADEWQCNFCGEWYSDAFLYCTKPECKAALKETGDD